MKLMIIVASLCAAAGAVLAQGNAAQSNATMPGADTPPAAAASAGRDAVMQACQGDFEKVCPGMVPGDGRLGPCVRQNIAKLSPGCQDAMKALRGAGRPGQ